MKRFLLMLFLILMSAGLATGASAMPILEGGPDDSGFVWSVELDGRKALAEFELDDSILTLILKNEAVATSVGNEVLTGLFFDINLTLPKPHVLVNSDSLIVKRDGTSDGGLFSGVVDKEDITRFYGPILDGEYGWLTHLDGSEIGEEDGEPIYGQNNGGLGFYGLAATGFDPPKVGGTYPAGWTGFGDESVIDPSFSYDPDGLDGAEFGIASGDVSGLVASIPYVVRNAIKVTWNLEGLEDGFELDITQVNFLYGTDYDTTPVPEPATMLLLGCGLIGMAGIGRRKFFKK